VICVHEHDLTSLSLVYTQTHTTMCPVREVDRYIFVCYCSSTNVKKWESELQTMKNNNTRLQAALEESKQHLSQWKTQLQKYKEDNDSLKKKVGLRQGKLTSWNNDGDVSFCVPFSRELRRSS